MFDVGRVGSIIWRFLWVQVDGNEWFYIKLVVSLNVTSKVLGVELTLNVNPF
jgi:hypothetical protein